MDRHRCVVRHSHREVDAQQVPVEGIVEVAALGRQRLGRGEHERQRLHRLELLRRDRADHGLLRAGHWEECFMFRLNIARQSARKACLPASVPMLAPCVVAEAGTP